MSRVFCHTSRSVQVLERSTLRPRPPRFPCFVLSHHLLHFASVGDLELLTEISWRGSDLLLRAFGGICGVWRRSFDDYGLKLLHTII